MVEALAKEEWLVYWTEFKFKIYLTNESSLGEGGKRQPGVWALYVAPAYELVELLIVNQSRDGSTVMRMAFAFVSPIYHLPIIQLSAVRDLGGIGNRGQDECSSYCSQSNCILPRPVGSFLRHCRLPTDWCPCWSGRIAVTSGESHQFWPICWVALLAVFFSSVSILFIIL